LPDGGGIMLEDLDIQKKDIKNSDRTYENIRNNFIRNDVNILEIVYNGGMILNRIEKGKKKSIKS
jgi:hypothetical protein